MKSIGLLGLVLVVAACATESKYEQILDAWVDVTEERLIEVWGEPTDSFKTDGGRVLHYSYVSDLQGRVLIASLGTGLPVAKAADGGTPYIAAPTSANGSGYYCTTRFTITKDGKVGQWSHDGNGCLAR